MSKLTDDELLDALGVDIAPSKAVEYTPLEERIIAGFEDIQRFVEEHNHLPRHHEEADIFERLYAVRLDKIRQLPEARALLTSIDTQGLLDRTQSEQTIDVDALDDDDLLDQLGAASAPEAGDITVLKHVRSSEERRLAEEIANRVACKDFDRFKPLFAAVKEDLDTGRRRTLRFGRDISIAPGNFFILSGQFVYVESVGELFKTPNGEPDARLRVIYDNGTESNLLMRSLQRALYKDEAGRRLTEPSAGPLFDQSIEEGDLETGTIYVLRSLSEHPYIAEHRELIHKIGVTGGKVKTRIANAARDATYLLADVEVVATYKLANINRIKMERLFHKVFAPAQLNLTIEDRFGNPVQPREWFLVPLPVIDELVQRIIDGNVENIIYKPSDARLMSKDGT